MGWMTRPFRRARADRDLDDELMFHVEAQTRDLIAEGVAPGEARRRALAAFGGLEPIKEAARATRPARFLDDLRADLRYGSRTLRHQPGFAATAILTLTLGIGANTAIFSVVHAMLLQALPVRQPNRLVLFSGDSGSGTTSTSADTFPDGVWGLFSTQAYGYLRARPAPFAGIAAFESGDFVTTARVPGRPDDSSQRVEAKFVSGNYFDVMGASPALGRALRIADDSPAAPAVAVASDRFWRDRLGADPNAIGGALTIDNGGRDAAVTVVGIMPRSFFGERVRRAPDLWVPISQRDPALRDRQNVYWLSLIGRLPAGGTIAGAQTATVASLQQFLTARMTPPLSPAIERRIRAARIEMVSGARGISTLRDQYAQVLVLLLSAVALVLLIACANIGTLFLARAASREREIAVRRALGAGRGRLVRQWLTESALMGAAGAAGGILLAKLAAPRLLNQVVAGAMPVSVSLNGPVLVLTAGVTLLACLLFGLAPSLQAGRVDPAGSLRLAGRGHRRRRLFGVTEPFVVAQIAMSLVLVLAATLLVRSLINLTHEPFGFEPDHVLLASINPRPARVGVDGAGALYERIADEVSRVPGVERVTFARFGPFEGHWSSFKAKVDGYEPPPDEVVRLETVQVGPDHPQTLGMPIVAGRSIGKDDTAGSLHVAVVNEAFAARYFPSQSPLGRHIDLRGPTEIVGVVRDAQYHTAHEPIHPTVFIPMLQEETGMALDCEIEVRTLGQAGTVANAVREAIASVDSRVAIGRIRTLREQIASTFGPERTAMAFIAAFAVLALLVASIGLYGVVSHGLAKRTNEIGVRIALGAGRRDIVRLAAHETFVRLAGGLVVGGLLAEGAGALLGSQLYGVTPRDPASLVIAALVLTLVVILATARPILRALRIDPVVALRAE